MGWQVMAEHVLPKIGLLQAGLIDLNHDLNQATKL